MNRAVLAALLTLSLASPLYARKVPRRWIAVRTFTDARSLDTYGAVHYFGTFPNEQQADAFCRHLIAAPGPSCKCSPEPVIRPAEVKVKP